MDFDDDDVMSFLPELKKEEPTSSSHNPDEFDPEPSWYVSFMNQLSTDVAPQKLHDLVVDYLICEGYREAAEMLCADAEMKFPKPDEADNLDTLEARNEIRNAIVNGEIETAMELINKIAPELLPNDTKLHFQLLRQQLVELIRRKEVEKALQFAQEHLVDKCNQPQDLLGTLERTYALLAFENPEKSPFGQLMNPNQRHMLATEVNSAILAGKKNSASRLERLFRLIVWNHNQYITKGESCHPPRADEAANYAREIFNLELGIASDEDTEDSL